MSHVSFMYSVLNDWLNYNEVEFMTWSLRMCDAFADDVLAFVALLGPSFPAMSAWQLLSRIFMRRNELLLWQI